MTVTNGEVGIISSDSEQNRLREDCWTNSVYAFGTATMFERRARKLQRRLKILTFIGLGVPLAVGASVLTFAISQRGLAAIEAIAGTLLFAQVVWSFWALVADWEGKYAYAIESMVANHRSAKMYKRLAEHAPQDIARQFDLLEAETAALDKGDYQQNPTEKEKRRALRAALFQYRRSCGVCKEVPSSPTGRTNCAACSF